MDVQLPDGTIVKNVPEGTTQAELMRRLGQGAGTPPSAEWQAKTMARMTLANKPWYEKAAIQMGAGVDDFVSGVKQLFASDKPEGLNDLVTGDTPLKRSQREVGRTRLLKKALAEESDTNTLPDWVPTAGATLQGVGESLPYMAVPVGAYGRAATLLPRAIGLMKSAATPARLGTAALIGDTAIGGAVSGALSPTAEGESRLFNTAVGLGTGAALPAATTGVRSVTGVFSKAGGERKAAKEVADALAQGGDEQTVLRQTIDRLKNAQGANIPLSTAAQLNDAQLARLEAGSRTRNGANWYDFDQNQARAVANEFGAATGEAADLAARRDSRASNWTNRWNAAQQNLQPEFQLDLPAFRQNLDVAKMSPEASNPAVLNMLNAISGEIDRLGPNFNIGHLQQIRANLSAKYSPMNPSAFAGAPRDSMARLSTMQEIDNILNKATGGKWQGVVSGYEADSRLVDAAKAAGRARQTYYDPVTGRVLGVSADAAGDVPKITEAGLGRAMNAARGPGGSLLLSAQANDRLEALLGALRSQNIVQGVKRSATAGGGSDTASNQYAARAAGKVADALGASGSTTAAVGKGVLDKLSELATANKDRALADALQNPQQMVQLLEAKLKAGAPMTAQEHYLLSLLRGVPAATTGN